MVQPLYPCRIVRGTSLAALALVPEAEIALLALQLPCVTAVNLEGTKYKSTRCYKQYPDTLGLQSATLAHGPRHKRERWS